MPNPKINTSNSHPITPPASPSKKPEGKKTTLYKTELCRSWEETGHCRYGNKCQFAHSPLEVRNLDRHPKYKTEMCKTFWDKGTCPYGKRCCFVHLEKGKGTFEEAEASLKKRAQEDLQTSEIKESVTETKTPVDSTFNLSSLLADPLSDISDILHDTTLESLPEMSPDYLFTDSITFEPARISSISIPLENPNSISRLSAFLPSPSRNIFFSQNMPLSPSLSSGFSPVDNTPDDPLVNNMADSFFQQQSPNFSKSWSNQPLFSRQTRSRTFTEGSRTLQPFNQSQLLGLGNLGPLDENITY